MKRLFLAAGLVALFCSCGGGGGGAGDGGERYRITPGDDRLAEGTKFSGLLAEYRYIVPEVTDESLFAYIDKAYIDRGELYLYDYDFRNPNSKVLVFDAETGKFLRAIGSQGRGPGEYVDLSSFTLDKPRREVLVSDGNGKILIYDAATGAFKRSFEVGFYPVDIEYVDAGTIACEASRSVSDGGPDDRLYLVDREGAVIGSHIPNNEKNRSVLGRSSFSRGDAGEIVFRLEMSDSLFTVTPQGPEFTRFVDFGADAVTWEAWKNFPRREQTGSVDTRAGMKSLRGAIEAWSETGTHIWFVYFDRGAPAIAVFDKRTGETFCYGLEMGNDVVFDTMPLQISAADGDWFIGTNDAYSIVDNTAATAPENLPAGLPADLRALGEGANPVITLVKFK